MQHAKLLGYEDVLLKVLFLKQQLHCWHKRPSSVTSNLLHQYISFIYIHIYKKKKEDKEACLSAKVCLGAELISACFGNINSFRA